MPQTTQSRVTVLYAQNVKDKLFYPRRAAAALIDKADADFIAIADFTAAAIVSKVIDVQTAADKPRFVVIDLPNALPQDDVADITNSVRMLHACNKRSVVLGTVRNAAAFDRGFYAREGIPVVQWTKVAEGDAFGSDDILRLQNPPSTKKKSGGVLKWLGSWLP